ncbi:hypothetical protein OUZ56_024841 [Daphnia magna]|uniref:Uncharacterized protein n=1 Tax=Daphnia magna TaxID=35525 RepID=A0ABQ9ZI56_9CRUS|nr:hypothetical protein OUZ56_024841 [Daphnia magna]
MENSMESVSLLRIPTEGKQEFCFVYNGDGDDDRSTYAGLFSPFWKIRLPEILGELREDNGMKRWKLICFVFYQVTHTGKHG